MQIVVRTRIDEKSIKCTILAASLFLEVFSLPFTEWELYVRLSNMQEMFSSGEDNRKCTYPMMAEPLFYMVNVCQHIVLLSHLINIKNINITVLVTLSIKNRQSCLIYKSICFSCEVVTEKSHI